MAEDWRALLIDAARRDLQSGSVEALQRRVAEYSAMVELLRRLVPTQNEVPTLIDDISTRAKVRGITLGRIQPLGAEPDSSTFSAGAVPVLVTTIGIEVSVPAVARALSKPSRPLISSFG